MEKTPTAIEVCLVFGELYVLSPPYPKSSNCSTYLMCLKSQHSQHSQRIWSPPWRAIWQLVLWMQKHRNWYPWCLTAGISDCLCSPWIKKAFLSSSWPDLSLLSFNWLHAEAAHRELTEIFLLPQTFLTSLKPAAEHPRGVRPDCSMVPPHTTTHTLLFSDQTKQNRKRWLTMKGLYNNRCIINRCY